MSVRWIIQATSKVLAVVGVVLVVAIMAMTTYDVTARNLGAQPLRGTSELAEVMLVGAAFLTLPYAMQAGAHVATTVVVDRLATAWARRAELVGMVVVLLVLAWFSFEAVGFAIESTLSGETRFGSRQVAIWPGRVALALGTVVLTLEIALHCLDLARGHRPERGGPDDLPEGAHL